MKAKTKGHVLPMSSFSICELLDFASEWSPPQTPLERRRSRWQSWGEYFADFEAVRDELEASHMGATMRELGRVPFAARMITEFPQHPDEVYEGHAHRSRVHGHFYRRDDGHDHGDGLGAAIERTERDTAAIALTAARMAP